MGCAASSAHAGTASMVPDDTQYWSGSVRARRSESRRRDTSAGGRTLWVHFAMAKVAEAPDAASGIRSWADAAAASDAWASRRLADPDVPLFRPDSFAAAGQRPELPAGNGRTLPLPSFKPCHTLRVRAGQSPKQLDRAPSFHCPAADASASSSVCFAAAGGGGAAIMPESYGDYVALFGDASGRFRCSLCSSLHGDDSSPQ
jgi:hypothetical protein